MILYPESIPAKPTEITTPHSGTRANVKILQGIPVDVDVVWCQDPNCHIDFVPPEAGIAHLSIRVNNQDIKDTPCVIHIRPLCLEEDIDSSQSSSSNLVFSM